MPFLDLFRKRAHMPAPQLTDDQFEWLKRAATAKGKGYQFIEYPDKLPINRFRQDESYIQAGSRNVWAAFRACHIVASTLLKVPTYVKDATGKEVMPLRTQGLSALMTHPNQFDTWEEMVYQWVFHMKLLGKAFWLKDEIDGYGRPHAIYPLLPQYMLIHADTQRKIGKFEYRINGRSKMFEPEEIIYFRRPSPNSGIEGLGDVGASESIFNEHINRNILNERFLENGAQPSGILIREDVAEDQTLWDKLKAKFQADYGGKRNAGKVAWMNGKWTYQQLGLTSQAMEALEREKWTVQQIFMAMGVPLSIAGIEGASNFATAKCDDINFRKYECVPLWDLFMGKLNAPMPTGMVRAFDESFRIDYRMDGLFDMGQIANDYKAAFLCAAVTPNEMRVAMGMAKSDNPLLDQYFVNGVPIELAGISGTPSSQISGIVAGGAPAPTRTPEPTA